MTSNQPNEDEQPQTSEPPKFKTLKQRRIDALVALHDATKPTLTVSQAALCLGIAVSTACNAAKTGWLMDGVRALQVRGSRRYVVAKADVIAVLSGTTQTSSNVKAAWLNDDALASL